MTSNELALRPSADVAARIDESPCPQFDLTVYSALVNVHVTAIDPEIPPHEREAARTVQEGALRRLVERVEAGRWSEHLPEPERATDTEVWPLPELGVEEAPTEKVPTRSPDDTVVRLAHDIMDLTDAQIWDQLQAMTYAERVEWFRSTD